MAGGGGGKEERGKSRLGIAPPGTHRSSRHSNNTEAARDRKEKWAASYQCILCLRALMLQLQNELMLKRLADHVGGFVIPIESVAPVLPPRTPFLMP